MDNDLQISSVPTSFSVSRERVLLVDDNHNLLYVASKILTSHQYSVTAVDSAEEALVRVRDGNFDLVISDISMPGMNGLEFLDSVKRINPLLTSVVITGSSTATMAVRAIKSGAQGFVPKPFTPDELIDSIQKALHESRMMRENMALKLYMPLLEKTNAALLNALEAKDQDSQGHSQRVADFAAKIAIELGVGDEMQTQIYFGALFHDIGKIGISDEILKKSGPLTPEESDEMMRHPEIGAHIISTAKNMVEASRIILHHHEWYDGSGYPNGLKGAEIPLGARIVAIVDAYEEMVSRRVYAESTPQLEAISKLTNGKGTQFDPTLVDLFIKLFNQYPYGKLLDGE